ncbi:MAG: acetyltransferase [Spirochaetales bacterium]|jgi:acetyltransferase EpsM
MILYGASGHGNVIAEILEAKGVKNIIFWDDDSEKINVRGYKIVKPLLRTNEPNDMIISIGNNSIRKSIAEKTNKHFNFALAIHPGATVSKRSEISFGSVIMPGSIINTDAIVGKHVIINSGAVIEHDCKVNDFVHVSPNATLCGNVTVGEGTHIGAGATIIQGIKIGKWVTVGAGAVVIRDIPDYAVVVGNPARITKYITPNI